MGTRADFTSALAKNDPPKLARSDPFARRMMKMKSARCPEETVPDLPAVVPTGLASRRPPKSLR